MKRRNIISLGMAALALTSCMAALPPAYDNQADAFMPAVEGLVCDEEDNPLEHIMVTLQWGNGLKDNVLYTSSEGRFKSFIPEEVIGTEGSLSLILEDIDGIENGGYFQTLTDKVLLYQDTEVSDTTVISLDYRLTRATPSANTPQF